MKAVTSSPMQPAKPIGCSVNTAFAGIPGCVIAAMNLVSSESPITIIMPLACGSVTEESKKPITVSGRAITKPASGPPKPMLIKARREGIGWRILMNAPRVPMPFRNGMKYGSVAFTPWSLHITKCPIS
ncbi:hypothetical protein JW905_12660 [bacterium]|nr:hypothetical protein [candidate division CSSED10-310 bacterium]